VTDQEILDALHAKTAELSIVAEPQQHNLMQEWIRLLHHWNQKYNLSAKRDSDDILEDLACDILPRETLHLGGQQRQKGAVYGALPHQPRG